MRFFFAVFFVDSIVAFFAFVVAYVVHLVLFLYRTVVYYERIFFYLKHTKLSFVSIVANASPNLYPNIYFKKIMGI